MSRFDFFSNANGHAIDDYRTTVKPILNSNRTKRCLRCRLVFSWKFQSEHVVRLFGRGNISRGRCVYAKCCTRLRDRRRKIRRIFGDILAAVAPTPAVRASESVAIITIEKNRPKGKCQRETDFFLASIDYGVLLCGDFWGAKLKRMRCNQKLSLEGKCRRFLNYGIG